MGRYAHGPFRIVFSWQTQEVVFRARVVVGRCVSREFFDPKLLKRYSLLYKI